MKPNKKISQLMMIDDDEGVLSINQHIVLETGYVEEVLPFQSANRALKHLLTTENWPEIILSDIQMPVLDGWAFIDHYDQLLARSMNQGMLCLHADIACDYDLDELERRNSIEMFITKPLTVEKVELIIAHYCNKY